MTLNWEEVQAADGLSPTPHTQLIGDNTVNSGVKWQLEVCSLIIVNPLSSW